MVGLSNVLLILASLTGLTNGGLLDGLFKPTGNNSNSALGGALGKAFGTGLLSGLFTGVGRSPAREKMDPKLANVLATFGQEFGDNSATSPAGSGASPREPESSEEKTKTSSNNAGGTGPTRSQSETAPIQAPDKPATPESGSQTPQNPATGESGAEITTKPNSQAPGSEGTPGGDVARNVGAAAGAAIATSLITVIMDAIKRNREKKNKRKDGPQQVGARREKRSLVGELGLMESKGAGKGRNHGQDLSNSFYCGRHEIPNTVGARDRFCHPSSTWNTTMRLLPECVCQPGFLRNSWGECISARECNQCRSKHRFNMDYHVCGSQCPIVCNQPVNEYCPTTCVRKCACRPGYIRKYPNGPCVSIKQCLPACRGRNQIFSLCSSLCPPTCRRPVPKRCPKVCAGEGCVCKPGFVVKKWEPLICVRPERCPGRRRKCKGPNQVYTRCRRRCAPSCFTRRHRYCGKGCIGRGCVCKRGFVVLQWRPLVCVRRNQCPARRKKCPAKNQIYKYCKSKCPPTCADKKPRKCGSACAGEGCACKPGFVIKQQNPLVCVRRFRCRSIKKRPNKGNGRRVPHPDDLLPWSSMPN